jgi:hypothetical protein
VDDHLNFETSILWEIKPTSFTGNAGIDIPHLFCKVAPPLAHPQLSERSERSEGCDKPVKQRENRIIQALGWLQSKGHFSNCFMYQLVLLLDTNITYKDYTRKISPYIRL